MHYESWEMKMDSFGVFLLSASKSLDFAFWSSKVLHQIAEM